MTKNCSFFILGFILFFALIISIIISLGLFRFCLYFIIALMFLALIFWKRQTKISKVVFFVALGLLVFGVITLFVYILNQKSAIDYRIAKASIVYDPTINTAEYYTFGQNEGMKKTTEKLNIDPNEKAVFIGNKVYRKNSDTITIVKYQEYYQLNYWPEVKKITYTYHYKKGATWNEFYYISNPDGSDRKKIESVGFYGLCKESHNAEAEDLVLGRFFGNHITGFHFSEDGKKLIYSVLKEDYLSGWGMCAFNHPMEEKPVAEKSMEI